MKTILFFTAIILYLLIYVSPALSDSPIESGLNLSQDRSPGVFAKTTSNFSWNTSCFDCECQQEFGPGYRIADWNEVVAFINLQGYSEFFMQSGMTFYRSNGWLTRAGQHFWSSSRHYFMERHDGNVPSGWLVHASIGSNTIDLGSYWNSRPILCYKPNMILNLSVFIEGFYNIENHSQISDTISVELRNATSPYALADQSNGVVASDGMIQLNFTNASGGNYFLKVIHRNSIETWSANAITLSSSTQTNYSLSSSSSQALGNNQIHVDTSPLRFAIYSGDVDQDGIVDATDLDIVDHDASIGVGGYVRSDVNGDFFVDGSDLLIVDNNATGFVSMIRP